MAGILKGGFWESRKPRIETPDPYTLYRPQANLAASAIFGDTEAGPGTGPGRPVAQFGATRDTFVGPTPHQQDAMATLRANLGSAQPVFGEGTGLLSQTVRGEYLDPTQSQAYRRLESALRESGSGAFQDMLDRIRSDAARGGAFSSSARLAQENQAAGRVGTEIARQLGEAGFAQYARERGLQQDAMARALGLSPALAGQLFTQAEHIRSAEQQARQADEVMRLRAFLADQGLQQQQIDNMLSYLQAVRSPSVVMGEQPSGHGELAQQARESQDIMNAFRTGFQTFGAPFMGR